MKCLLLFSLLFFVSTSFAEIVIIKDLNLRESQLLAIVELARKQLPHHQGYVSVRAYKLPNGVKESRVVFEPFDITPNSFTSNSVSCTKSKRQWICEEPEIDKYYYQGELSHSILLGPKVTPENAQMISDFAKRTGNSFNLGSSFDRLTFGSRSSIYKEGDTQYMVLGTCNCLLEIRGSDIQFVRDVHVLE